MKSSPPRMVERQGESSAPTNLCPLLPHCECPTRKQFDAGSSNCSAKIPGRYRASGKWMRFCNICRAGASPAEPYEWQAKRLPYNLVPITSIDAVVVVQPQSPERSNQPPVPRSVEL